MIDVDLNRDRIKTVLKEAYSVGQELLAVSFDISADAFVSQIEPYLGSNRVTLPVFLSLPSKRYPDLKIEVNLRRAKVFARIPSHARNHPKQVLLNRYLKNL